MLIRDLRATASRRGTPMSFAAIAAALNAEHKRTKRGGPWQAIQNVSSASPEYYSVTNLTPGTTYWFQVAEREAGLRIETSPALEAVQPGAPALEYHAIGNSSAVLNWTNPGRYGGEIAFHDYTVSEAVVAGNWSDLGSTTNASDTSFTLARSPPSGTSGTCG